MGLKRKKNVQADFDCNEFSVRQLGALRLVTYMQDKYLSSIRKNDPVYDSSDLYDDIVKPYAEKVTNSCDQNSDAYKVAKALKLAYDIKKGEFKDRDNPTRDEMVELTQTMNDTLNDANAKYPDAFPKE